MEQTWEREKYQNNREEQKNNRKGSRMKMYGALFGVKYTKKGFIGGRC